MKAASVANVRPLGGGNAGALERRRAYAIRPIAVLRQLHALSARS